MTVERSVKTNLNVNKENKHTINSRTVVADLFNKKLVNLQLVLEIQPHKSLKKVKKLFTIMMTKCSLSRPKRMRFLKR